MKLLRELPAVIMNDVILNFHPRDVSRDVNPCFCYFVKSRMHPRQVYAMDVYQPSPPVAASQWEDNNYWVSSSIEAFVRRWNLSESAVKLLHSLSPEIIYDVITTFSPNDTARDVNAIFVSLARSRAKAMYRPDYYYYYGYMLPDYDPEYDRDAGL